MTNRNPDSLRKQRFKARLSVQHENSLHSRLRQHLPAAFNERWTRRHWIHAGLFASIGLMVATIIPGFSQPVAAAGYTQASLPLELPALEQIQSDQPASTWHTLQVSAGQTLGAIFNELQLPASVMHRVLENEHARTAFARLRPGTEISFNIPAQGQLHGLRFNRDPGHRVELDLQGEEIAATVTARETTTRTAVASGEIRHSLYASASRAGLPANAIAVLTDEIFKYDIDFSKDVQPGDRFNVVYDETWREGERIDASKVLAATFTTGSSVAGGAVIRSALVKNVWKRSLAKIEFPQDSTGGDEYTYEMWRSYYESTGTSAKYLNQGNEGTGIA